MKPSQISKLKDEFQKMEIKLSGSDSYSFNQHETLRRINAYLNNRYLDRDDGTPFYNIWTSRRIHFAKNLDLDTKNLQPYGIGEFNFYSVWILKMKFYAWCKKNGLAIKLNDLAEGLGDYGSMVWRLIKRDGKYDVEEENLINLYFDPSAESIRKADQVIIVHHLNETELLDKQEVWDNVDKVLEKERKKNKDKPIDAKIYEFWGYDEGEYKNMVSYGEGDDAIILLEDEDVEPEDFPLYDFHLGRYQGRWMRVGGCERLFDLQVRKNQLMNQNAQASEIASLLLLRSKNANVSGNVLEQAANGQIVNDDDLQQIVLQNPGLANFLQEFNIIEREADKLCMTPEIITGEKPQSDIPFRSLVTLNNNAKSAFDFVRQRIGETLSTLLLDKILPSVVKDWNKGELFEVAGDEQDIMLYDTLAKNQMREDYKKESILSGQLPTEEMMMMGDMMYDQDPDESRPIKIPEKFFNFEYGIRMNVTGEQMDKAAQNDASFNAITMIAQNPAIANIPQFKQYCEINGINYWKLSPEQMASVQQGAVSAKPMMEPKRDALMAEVK